VTRTSRPKALGKNHRAQGANGADFALARSHGATVVLTSGLPAVEEGVPVPYTSPVVLAARSDRRDVLR
jgi:hypothetical protein